MIQTHELRRNNLIMYGNMIYPVERITETSISVRLSSQSLRTARPHEFEPIPLSPEILQACGFEKDDHDFWHFWKLSIVMPGFAGYPDGRLYFNSWMIMEPPKYLHLLMNIHFFLTGTELAINLEKVKV